MGAWLSSPKPNNNNSPSNPISTRPHSSEFAEDCDVESDARPIGRTDNVRRQQSSRNRENTPPPRTEYRDHDQGNSQRSGNQNFTNSEGRSNDDQGNANSIPPPMNVNQFINAGSNSKVYNQTIGAVGHFQIGNTINLTLPPKTKPKVHRQRSSYNSSSIPRGILDSTRVVTINVMRDVSRELGYTWKRLARELGMEEFELENIEHDYVRDGLREMALQMLRYWVERESTKATVGALAKALYDTGRVDIAMKLTP